MAKSANLNKIVAKSALKTIAILILIVIIFISLFCLISPLRAGEITYSLGMKKTGAWLYDSAVEGSDDFDLLFNSAIMAIASNDNKIIYNATHRLYIANGEAFEKKITDSKYRTDLEGLSLATTKEFILTNYFRSGVIINSKPDEVSGLFDLAIWSVSPITDKNYTQFNAVRGFMEGIALSKTAEYVKYLDFLNAVYNNTAKDWASQNSSYKSYIAKDARYIIFNRIPDYLNSEEYELWKGR